MQLYSLITARYTRTTFAALADRATSSQDENHKPGPDLPRTCPTADKTDKSEPANRSRKPKNRQPQPAPQNPLLKAEHRRQQPNLLQGCGMGKPRYAKHTSILNNIFSFFFLPHGNREKKKEIPCAKREIYKDDAVQVKKDDGYLAGCHVGWRDNLHRSFSVKLAQTVDQPDQTSAVGISLIRGCKGGRPLTLPPRGGREGEAIHVASG